MGAGHSTRFAPRRTGSCYRTAASRRARTPALRCVCPAPNPGSFRAGNSCSHAPWQEVAAAPRMAPPRSRGDGCCPLGGPVSAPARAILPQAAGLAPVRAGPCTRYGQHGGPDVCHIPAAAPVASSSTSSHQFRKIILPRLPPLQTCQALCARPGAISFVFAGFSSYSDRRAVCFRTPPGTGPSGPRLMTKGPSHGRRAFLPQRRRPF
jgi:hypothetical protein